MASIDKRVRKGPDGKPVTVYRVMYRDPDGKQRSQTFAKMGEARAWMHDNEATKGRGAWVNPTDGRQTFGHYAQAWSASRLHKPTTTIRVESDLRNHVLGFFGDQAIASIRRSQIQGWVKDRAAVLAPTTTEVLYRIVAAIFASAVADKVLDASPCVRIDLPPKSSDELVLLTTEQVEAVAAAMPARYRALVEVAAGTGLRQGEVMGLCLEQVDFLRRTLKVDRQLVTLPGGPVFGTPKTASSVRTIPLADVVLESLSIHLATFRAGPGGLTFTTGAGTPLSRSHFGGSVWPRALARAGLPKGTKFHGLRHFYASLLIRFGESVPVVQRRLGHATAKETLDTYSHLWPDADDTSRAAVDAVLGNKAQRVVAQMLPGDAVATQSRRSQG